MLKVATQFDHRPGRKFAIRGIERQQVSAMRLLRMSRQYRVKQWFTASLLELFEVPLFMYEQVGVHTLETALYTRIVRTRCVVEASRRWLLSNPPDPLRMDPCALNKPCHHAIVRVWDTVTRQMLLADEWHSADSIQEATSESLSREATETPCSDCVADYMAKLATAFEDDSIHNDALDELCKLYGF